MSSILPLSLAKNVIKCDSILKRKISIKKPKIALIETNDFHRECDKFICQEFTFFMLPFIHLIHFFSFPSFLLTQIETNRFYNSMCP